MVNTSFHPGVLHADHKARYVNHSEAYVEKMQTQYGYSDIRFVPQSEVRELVNSAACYGGTLDEQAGHVNPLQLALELGRMAQAAGATLHEQSQVKQITYAEKMLYVQPTLTSRQTLLCLPAMAILASYTKM